MITRGGALLRSGLWMSGIEPRDYYTPKYVNLYNSPEGVLEFASWWHYGLDALMALLVIGFQIGGAFIGVLLLNTIDKSGLLTASVTTKPFGNLAGEDGLAFLAAWALNTVVLAAYASTTSTYHKLGVRSMVGPVATGFAVFVGVFVSYTFGVGTTLNFAADLALAIIVPGATSKLWISAVAQLTAAATVFVLAWFMNLVDRMTEHHSHQHQHGHSHVISRGSSIVLLRSGSELSASDPQL